MWCGTAGPPFTAARRRWSIRGRLSNAATSPASAIRSVGAQPWAASRDLHLAVDAVHRRDKGDGDKADDEPDEQDDRRLEERREARQLVVELAVEVDGRGLE